MSRVINTNVAGKERTRLSKSIVLAIRELMQQTEVTSLSRDLVAFLVLALSQIAEGVETSVAAWEKRDYWLKADRFRMEWEWSRTLSEQLYAALMADDWAHIAGLVAQVGQRVGNVQVSPRHRLGKPWIGAWRALQQRENP
ncbi:MAG: hypothetical protein Fur0018_01510 [Anaerolineales bacterium]